MKAAIALTMIAGAGATDCSPGYKHKAVLTNLKCKSSAETAKLQGTDNCNANCCDLNPKTCLGQVAVGCPATKYMSKDGSKATQAQKDTWAAIATTAANFQADCCVAKAKCGSSAYSCPAGKVKDSTKATQDCTNDDASCATTVGCCKADTNICDGATLSAGGNLDTDATCTANFISGKTACAGDASCETAWKATKFVPVAGNNAKTDDAKKAACCVVKPSCLGSTAAHTCNAGTKFGKMAGGPPAVFAAFTSANDVQLANGAQATFQAACCVADTDVCKGATVTCAAGQYQNSALDSRSVKGATAAQINKKCCSTKAKCSNHVCAAGYKAKKSAANTDCTGDASTCTEALCCDADLTTCGGNFPTLGGLTCATGFYDERTFWQNANGAAGSGITKTPQSAKDAWNLKNTSAATKTKECCTPVANCTNITTASKAGVTTTPAPGAATTTPAPVVTTTPAAAPALKFSEHKVAVQQSSGGSNMVWLGLGAFMGMGVLMFVQHVRSARISSNTRDVSLE